MSGTKKTTVPVLLAALLSILLLIPFFSDIVMAIGPPPQPQWEIGEPFSPLGFAVVSQPQGEGLGYEFTMLNGTSASVFLQVKPTAAAEFPLNLNFSVSSYAVTTINGQFVSRGLINASAVLSPTLITLKNASDSAIMTMAFTANKDAPDTLYGINLGRWFGPGTGESTGPVFYLRINPTSITWTGTTATTATTTVISTTTAISTETITDASTYAWALSATAATAVLAAVLLLQRRSNSSPSSET